jgi:hypothetical protein
VESLVCPEKEYPNNEMAKAKLHGSKTKRREFYDWSLRMIL